MMLDEKSPVALYYQLKEKLKGKIERNEWTTGERIPTERELCALYHVSRMTVRLALGELEQEGFLYRKQGKGTFVTIPKIEQKLQQFYSFSEEIRKMGMAPSTRILSFDRIQGSDAVTTLLNREAEEEVYRIRRIRLADNEPFAIETSYVPGALCPGMTEEDIAAHGLYNTLKEKWGIVVREAEEVFEAVTIDSESAYYLKTGKHAPGLFLQRVAGNGEAVVELCESLIRGDRFKYKISLK